ncbi:MAG: molybdopterin molybdenumtransferase MoeA, partial [Rhizobiales bacterium]|nr:molybdopterin molybdenumtransferase MoeA [Hyphomicrobiales bacterium]
PLAAYRVRSAFAYTKRPGRREYVRVSLVRAADGAFEAVKYPREGAGVITSLTETDGLAELADDTTQVAPGDSIGFIPYSAITG